MFPQVVVPPSTPNWLVPVAKPPSVTGPPLVLGFFNFTIFGRLATPSLWPPKLMLAGLKISGPTIVGSGVDVGVGVAVGVAAAVGVAVTVAVTVTVAVGVAMAVSVGVAVAGAV